MRYRKSLHGKHKSPTKRKWVTIQGWGYAVFSCLLFSKNQKTALLSKNRLQDFCYLTLFTFMRRSRTRKHMETKKVMMK